MPHHKSVKRSRKSVSLSRKAKKSVSRPRKAKSPKKARSRKVKSPTSRSKKSPTLKNRSYRFSEPWKCVKPYNKDTATTKDRLNACSETGPAKEGYEKRGGASRQICMENCYQNDDEKDKKNDEENDEENETKFLDELIRTVDSALLRDDEKVSNIQNLLTTHIKTYSGRSEIFRKIIGIIADRTEKIEIDVNALLDKINKFNKDDVMETSLSLEKIHKYDSLFSSISKYIKEDEDLQLIARAENTTFLWVLLDRYYDMIENSYKLKKNRDIFNALEVKRKYKEREEKKREEKKREENEREEKKREEKNKEFLRELLSNLIEKIKHVKIDKFEGFNENEIDALNDFMKEIQTFLYADRDKREKKLTDLKNRMKDLYSTTKSTREKCININYKVIQQCAKYLEEKENEKEKRGEKRKYHKRYLMEIGKAFMWNGNQMQIKMSPVTFYVSDTTDWSRSNDDTLKKDLLLLIGYYETILLYDISVRASNIMFECIDETGLKCLEKEASRNCTIM